MSLSLYDIRLDALRLAHDPNGIPSQVAHRAATYADFLLDGTDTVAAHSGSCGGSSDTTVPPRRQMPDDIGFADVTQRR